MPIISTDIELRLSGTSGTPAGSLGGAINAAAIADNSLHNLFDVVSSAETAAGDIEYRCFYVRNSHGSLTLQSAKVWIDAQTPSIDTVAAIGVGSAPVNGTEQSIASESTAPIGISWTEAVGEGNALNLGDIPAGQHKAVWVRRTVSAGASAYTNDEVVIRIQGDTAA